MRKNDERLSLFLIFYIYYSLIRFSFLNPFALLLMEMDAGSKFGTSTVPHILSDRWARNDADERLLLTLSLLYDSDADAENRIDKARKIPSTSGGIHRIVSNTFLSNACRHAYHIRYHVVAVAAAIRGRRSEGRGQSEEKSRAQQKSHSLSSSFCLAGAFIYRFPWHGS